MKRAMGLLVLGMFACVAVTPAQAQMTGRVKVDGSSTVAPITMAAAEMFRAKEPKVEVTVGISGTGGGFKKFLDADAGLRTDISDASRPIKEAELKKAAEVKVEFIEIPIAIDGLAVVVNPSNSFCDHLTLAELKKIWEPESKIKNWKDVRAGFPDLAIKLYGPGTDSGTFDYFTEAVNGKEKACRADFNASENDNTLVQGVAGDAGALGYFGFSYYEANKGKLKLLGVDKGDGKAVKPSLDVIRGGQGYALARPLFIYVNSESAKRADVKAFIDFYLSNASKIVEHPKVNYVAFPSELYELGKKRFMEGKTGSVMASAPHSTTDLLGLFKKP